MLKSGETVDIFILPDNGLLKYGVFSLNLAAGLEDSLIAQIKPSWNGGNREAAKNIEINNGKDEENSLSVENIYNSKSDEEGRIFTVKLGIAYYNQGFINIPIRFTDVIGSHGEEIEIFVKDMNIPTIGYINRTANNNKTPRIMGGKELKKKIQKHYTQDNTIEIEIISRQSISIK